MRAPRLAIRRPTTSLNASAPSAAASLDVVLAGAEVPRFALAPLSLPRFRAGLLRVCCRLRVWIDLQEPPKRFLGIERDG